jgi:hypothetical protein
MNNSVVVNILKQQVGDRQQGHACRRATADSQRMDAIMA